MSKKSTSWFAYVKTILATIGGEHGKINDKKTYGVMAKVIPGLMSKRGIDGDLKAAFLSNINIRANQPVIEHPGPIVLTHAQKTNARAHGWDKLEAFDTLYAGQLKSDATVEVRNECGMDQQAQDAILHWFRTHSAADPHSFRTHSALMPRDVLETLTSWLSSNGMEWNVNHESAMTFASQVHEDVVIPGAIHEEVHDGTEPAAIHPDSKEKKVRERNASPPLADALSIWVKETKGKVRASGNLEVGGQKWSLSFAPFYGALESIPQTPENGEWLSVMAGSIANAVVPVEQSLSGIAARSTMSGLHDAKDVYCYKAPVADRSAVVLYWDGERPIRATIIDGDDRHTFDLSQRNNTLFKGAIKMEAAA